MNFHSRRPGAAFMLLAAVLLASCGGGDSEAERSDIAVTGTEAGVSPFIGFIQLKGQDLARVQAIRLTVAAKPGATAQEVDIRYAIDAARRRGYLDAGLGSARMPVFGLYAGHANSVRVRLDFGDGSVQSLPVQLSTDAYVDPTGLFAAPNVIKRREPGAALGFSYFAMKSSLGAPVVVDTDGEIRWTVPGIASGRSSIVHDNAFVIGDQVTTQFYRLELDGSMKTGLLSGRNYTAFHHNIDPGKTGLLAQLDASSNGVSILESSVTEFDLDGQVLKEWDFASIIGDHMRSLGDDPGNFVRPGTDWFHVNAATYDPRDDSIIASSRENFVIKVDYQSGQIKWILGDPSKHWFTFPSLRAKALTLQGGGFYPIGQHATSVTSDGLLMMFNDGAESFNNPAGTAAGERRGHSVVSAYSIDPVAMTASEAWQFDHGRTIFSDICSSAYEARDKSILVSYAAAESRAKARLVGLDAARNVVFDFEYRSPRPCDTSWNAVPIAFESMRFD